MVKRLIGAGVSIAVVVLIGIGITAYQKNKEEEDAPDVGQCVTVSGSSVDAQVEEAECGGDDVLYKVASDDGDCDPNELNYTVTIGEDDAVDLCLFYEVEVGDCLKEGINYDEKIPCDEATKGTDVEVTAVHDDAQAKCGKQDYAVVNEKRDQVVCLGLIA